MVKTRLAVFDCDGTLVDSEASIVAAMQGAFAVHGLAEPTAKAVRRVIGLPLKEAVAGLLPDADDIDHDKLTAGYKEVFSDLRRRGRVLDPLYPGALEAILELAASNVWLLGVATGKSRRGLLETLDRHGIRERFVTLQTSDIGPGKPHPDMLLRAIAESGAEAATTVMIGDTTFDIEMARRAGVMAIGVSWGYHDGKELLAAGADALIDDFGDLFKAAETLMEAAL
ncbi:MAG: haloacid dehalogenase [Rhodospirillales bacterium RIFCSPLOWO2_12_FULL_58_28]|nr:MAG: haloacid dehalogenase [Rhodospirillales bacterium RIFCSPLOWO2_02_FULL_58_16]OHC77771.1 MAG: haloacid dehalogenase [Rhodospirillales bacterium RIFCSPLOWO2_12_FULL_58_28]